MTLKRESRQQASEAQRGENDSLCAAAPPLKKIGKERRSYPIF